MPSGVLVSCEEEPLHAEELAAYRLASFSLHNDFCPRGVNYPQQINHRPHQLLKERELCQLLLEYGPSVRSSLSHENSKTHRRSLRFSNLSGRYSYNRFCFLLLI